MSSKSQERLEERGESNNWTEGNSRSSRTTIRNASRQRRRMRFLSTALLLKASEAKVPTKRPCGRSPCTCRRLFAGTPDSHRICMVFPRQSLPLRRTVSQVFRPRRWRRCIAGCSIWHAVCSMVTVEDREEKPSSSLDPLPKKPESNQSMSFIIPENIQAALYDATGLNCSVRIDPTNGPQPRIHINLEGRHIVSVPLRDLQKPTDIAASIPPHFDSTAVTLRARLQLLDILGQKPDLRAVFWRHVRSLPDGVQQVPSGRTAFETQETFTQTIFRLCDTSIARLLRLMQPQQAG